MHASATVTMQDAYWDLASAGMLFGWETVMTFVLVSVVYAVAIGEPQFGVVGPFAVGLSLFAMVFAGETLLHHLCLLTHH